MPGQVHHHDHDGTSTHTPLALYLSSFLFTWIFKRSTFVGSCGVKISESVSWSIHSFTLGNRILRSVYLWSWYEPISIFRPLAITWQASAASASESTTLNTCTKANHIGILPGWLVLNGFVAASMVVNTLGDVFDLSLSLSLQDLDSSELWAQPEPPPLHSNYYEYDMSKLLRRIIFVIIIKFGTTYRCCLPFNWFTSELLADGK